MKVHHEYKEYYTYITQTVLAINRTVLIKVYSQFSIAEDIIAWSFETYRI